MLRERGVCLDCAIWKVAGQPHGRSWAGLWGVLGALKAILEASWVLLGGLGGRGGVLDALGAVLEASWALLGQSWRPLGRSWGSLGSLVGALGALLEAS